MQWYLFAFQIPCTFVLLPVAQHEPLYTFITQHPYTTPIDHGQIGISPGDVANKTCAATRTEDTIVQLGVCVEEDTTQIGRFLNLLKRPCQHSLSIPHTNAS